MSVAPYRSVDSEPFWKGYESDEVRIRFCCDCENCHFPPGPVCPLCLSENLVWRDASGRGRVGTWAVIRRPYFKDFPPPYIFAQIELDEGVRLPATMHMEVEAKLHVGLPVKATFETLSNGMRLPVFVPVNEGGDHVD